MSRALLIVVSGPAGSGKTTLCARLTEANPRAIRRVITCTTRAPRAGEAEGVDYYFLTRPEFEAQVAAGVFLEHALVHGNLYGPRLADVAKHLDAGFDALLNVDVQGAATIRAMGTADARLAAALVTAFIRVSDPVELRRRLTGRGTDPLDEIDRRVATASEELKHAGEYQHVIESGSREADFKALQAIYHLEKSR
ncbi:MAG: guanylate kinase [Verrucomicrobia bacterium]|nr:guanylate kinase [Verrucomicrobiota bacterium]